MPALETSLTFFLTALLLAAAPGPDNLFVMAQSAVHGRKAGLLVVLGLCTGLVFHTALVAFGMAAVFRASPTAFLALKILGAAYLLVLAWQLFRSSRIQGNAPASAPSPTSLYRRGIIMNVTNPKVSVFFLAFLPQFTDPARGPISLQILYLGGLFCIATIFVFGGIALIAGTLSRSLSFSERTPAMLNKTAALIFVCIALHLLLARL